MTSTETDTTATNGDAPAEEAPATNVVEALRRVMRDLPHIGKDEHADPKQGGYAYRGIEAITRAVQPLLARHGVMFVPTGIRDRESVGITVNGKPWTDERMTVTYLIYGPGGPDDHIEAEAPAIGRDNSDKGANKCMTQAFKYVLLQTLCIADAKDDGDQASYATDNAPPEAEAPPQPDDPAEAGRIARVRELTRALRERGLEVTSTNDDGEVTVLDRPLLRRDEDGRLLPAITNAEADDLISYLVRSLADTVEPHPEATRSEAQQAPERASSVVEPPHEALVPPDAAERQEAAREALRRVKTTSTTTDSER